MPKLAKAIKKVFIEFYFTKLGEINEKLKRKYKVWDVLLIHFDTNIGPIFAGSITPKRDKSGEHKDFEKLIKKFDIKVKGQKSEDELKELLFCTSLLDYQSNISEYNKNLQLVLIDEGKKFDLIYEPVYFLVPSKIARGKKEMFTVIVINEKRVKKVAQAIAMEYYKILSKYFRRISKDYEFENLDDIHEFIKKDLNIQAGQTSFEIEEIIKPYIDKYFGL